MKFSYQMYGSKPSWIFNWAEHLTLSKPTCSIRVMYPVSGLLIPMQMTSLLFNFQYFEFIFSNLVVGGCSRQLFELN